MPDIRVGGLLSNFDTPPDEQPLSEGGKWASADSSLATWGPMMKTDDGARNDFTTDPPTHDRQLGMAYWTPESFDSSIQDVEVWGHAVGGGGGVAGHGWRLGLVQNPGPSSLAGYFAVIFHALDNVVILYKYTSLSTRTVLDSVELSLGGNNLYLLRKSDSTISFWRSTDGTVGNNWSQVLSATDNDYEDDLYLAMGAEDQGFGGICGWSSLGGGLEDIPQIYRRPFG